MYPEMKTTTHRDLIIASVAGLIALVTFAAPQSWQTMLTQTVVSPASARGDDASDTSWSWYLHESTRQPITAVPPAHWPEPKTTQWHVSKNEKAVSVGIGVADKKPGIDIPDGDRLGVNIPFEIANPHYSGSPTITQVDIHLNIDHSWLSNLVITLTSPDGITATLYNRMGPRDSIILHACSNKGMDIVLVETAPEARRLESSQCPTVSDKYRAIGTSGGTVAHVLDRDGKLEGLFQTPDHALKKFNGHTPHGTWILNISDLAPAGRGTLTAAHLTVVSAR